MIVLDFGQYLLGPDLIPDTGMPIEIIGLNRNRVL